MAINAPSVLLPLLSVLAPLLVTMVAAAGRRVPAMFVFGDSLLDPGNNNHLTTLAKANFYPYGIDFPNGTTGRFCNGKTTADHLSELLGLPLILAFNGQARGGEASMFGVNYASAGGGILEDSGKAYGKLYSMDDQIENFELTLEDLRQHLGDKNATKLVNDSLFFVYIGLNDYISNYFLPFSKKARQYNPQSYANLLVHQYLQQLKKLYLLGGRTFLIGELGPLGCIPNSVAGGDSPLSSCVAEKNHLVLEFNSKLKPLVIKELNTNLTGSRFLLWDSYNSTMDIVNNFQDYGFKYPTSACCGAGKANGRMLCFRGLQCRNRSEYVFWDAFHPSDNANAILAKKAYQVLLEDGLS